MTERESQYPFEKKYELMFEKIHVYRTDYKYYTKKYSIFQ